MVYVLISKLAKFYTGASLELDKNVGQTQKRSTGSHAALLHHYPVE